MEQPPLWISVAILQPESARQAESRLKVETTIRLTRSTNSARNKTLCGILTRGAFMTHNRPAPGCDLARRAHRDNPRNSIFTLDIYASRFLTKRRTVSTINP
jgi:hypothetical protein